MSITRGWVGSQEELLAADLRDFVPVPVSEEEQAFAAHLAAERDAFLAARGMNGPAWEAMVDDIESSFVGERPVGAAGEELVEGVAEAARGMARATLAGREQGQSHGGRPGPVALAEGELTVGLESLAEVVAAGHAALFVLVRESVARKLYLDVGMAVHDWGRRRCPGLPPQLVNDLVAVARSADAPGTDLLADAVAAGTTAPHRAAQVVRTLERLRTCLRHDQQVAYATIAADAAANPSISERDLSILCRKLIVDLLEEPPEGDDDEGAQGPDPAGTGTEDAGGEGADTADAGTDAGDAGSGDAGAGDGASPWGSGADRRPRTPAERAEALRSLTRRPVGPGLTRYTFDAPDGDAALLDGILNGPLAAPAPATGADGGVVEADLRSVAQRRYDALLTVLSRGLGNPGAPPSTARASVIVTVAADPMTGRPAGAAFTQAGQVLPSSQAGRFACLGEVTPLVLGEHGEPLDLGRTRRLASPGQYKDLLVRDVHCTFPGCSMPGSWCDAHHVVWWSRDGGTDILNLVLLCPRHHTLVHTKDLHATVTGNVVYWHV
ncbi:HNH endonuclease signature motif containing protein [Ornithinimicrobium cerasi]|uniref:HNH endonuclease signature motif containing protein n=1 Tax=Ornithinimicrobium cerasi TaxID=2248773 RepID=UPI000EFFDE39|nr:HNH endonuclease signature motif containing protein [Ornithinimicrobium cerasi]